MDLFITYGFSGRYIGTREFLDSKPIAPVEALRLIRTTYDVKPAYDEHRTVLNYLLACAG